MITCPICGSAAEFAPPDIDLAEVSREPLASYTCQSCGRFVISELLLQRLKASPDWMNSSATLASAVQFAYGCDATPVLLVTERDVMAVNGRIGAYLAEHRQKIVDALLQAGWSEDAWRSPIHAVDAALGAGVSTVASRALARELLRSGIVRLRQHARNVLDPGDCKRERWE